MVTDLGHGIECISAVFTVLGLRLECFCVVVGALGVTGLSATARWLAAPMSALTFMPGSLPSPAVSTGHHCRCYDGCGSPIEKNVNVTPFHDELLLTALGYLTKSFWYVWVRFNI